MKLTEVFTKPKGKITWKKRTSLVWRGFFDVGDRVFEFTAGKGGAEVSMVHPVELTGEEIGDIWIIGFMQVKPDASHDITGGGKPVEVFNKALAALKELVKVEKPVYISFGAKEPNRMRLYNAMVKKLAKGLGYKALPVSGGNYLLKSKRAK
jgi:hypothetical protein